MESVKVVVNVDVWLKYRIILNWPLLAVTGNHDIKKLP